MNPWRIESYMEGISREASEGFLADFSERKTKGCMEGPYEGAMVSSVRAHPQKQRLAVLTVHLKEQLMVMSKYVSENSNKGLAA